MLSTAGKIFCDPGHQRSINLHGSRLLPQQGRMNGVPGIGEIKEHDSSRAPWHVWVGVRKAELWTFFHFWAISSFHVHFVMLSIETVALLFVSTQTIISRMCSNAQIGLYWYHPCWWVIKVPPSKISKVNTPAMRHLSSYWEYISAQEKFWAGEK